MPSIDRQLYSTHGGNATPFVLRMRFQIPVGLLICVLLPALLRQGGDFTSLLKPMNINGLFGISGAFLLAYYLNTRFGSYPGVNEGLNIFFSVSLSFVVLAVLLVLLRWDYNRVSLASSYGLTIGWLGIMYLFRRAITRREIAIVPGGNSSKLDGLSGYDWVLLSGPTNRPDDFAMVAADLRYDLSKEWQVFLTNCALSGTPVYHYKQLAESLTGKVEIEHLSENNMGSLIPALGYLKLKYGIDWIMAVLALPFLLLVYVLVAPIIIYTLKNSAIYSQPRVGYRGEIFTVYKFRTMTDVLESDNSESVRAHAMTEDNDRRVTRFGKFLRQYRIDELPQIFNILKGEMSWIGPRPEAVALSEWYETELAFYRYRHVLRPGITGWAQVNQGHVTLADMVLEKLNYDFYYIKNCSPWLDLLIVLRTIRTVFRRFGAR